MKQIEFPSSDTVGGVALSPNSSFAYFPVNSAGALAVDVFDIAAQQVFRSFSAGSGGAGAIAVSPDGSEIELGGANSEILAMNAASGEITATYATLGDLVTIAFSPDGSEIYIPNFDSSVLQVIDPQTAEITGQIPSGWTTEAYDGNYAVEISANGKTIVVAGQENFSFIDVVKLRVIGAVPFTTSFISVSLSPKGDLAYAVMTAPSGGAPQVLVIDVKSLTVISTLNLSSADRPTQGAVSPDGSTLYLGEQYCPSGGGCETELLKISTTSPAVLGRILLSSNGFGTGGIEFSRDGATAYVEGLYYSGGISIVNLSVDQVITTIPAEWGGAPIALAVGGKQDLIYELAPTNYNYYEIDLATQLATGISDGVGVAYPTDMAVSPDGRLLYITSEDANSVLTFATYPQGTSEYLGAINLPSASNGVVFSPF